LRLIEDRAKEQIDRINLLTQKSQDDKEIITRLLGTRDSEITNLDSLKELQRDLQKAEHSNETVISKSHEVFSRAESLTLRYEAETSIAKDIMNEDIAIAGLRLKYTELGIVGLVYEILKWDKAYERAVLATASEWMKAFVVSDVKSM